MPRSYVVALPLERGSDPLYVSIARALSNDIARNRLKPGEQLPSSRQLAAMLSVNRNTVHAALAELEAQGWIEARPARGVFVRAPSASETPRLLARARPAQVELPSRLGFELAPSLPLPIGAPIPDQTLLLTGGIPDPRLFPSELLARAYRRVLKRSGARLLNYGDARGEGRLRSALADMLRRLRGLAAGADDVLITRGSQHAIWLAAHSVLRPGDRVGVECWGYPPAWQALRSAGATLVPLEVDDEGVRIESLQETLSAGALRAVYLTPHHQYPTMVPLSARRRQRLLELAAQHRFAILEDDYAHEFQYEGRPRLPLASADRHGVVVYIGSLSKILAPGLRIGYAVGPAPLLARMAGLRSLSDRQGDAIAEAAVAELLEDGELERHTRRTRRIYQQRRDLLASELTKQLGTRVTFQVPAGGMALWVRVHGAQVERWVERARARGVTFRQGRELSLIDRGDVPYVRMGFTNLDERELVRAVRLAAAAF